MVFSAMKTYYMIVSKKSNPVQYPDLVFNGNILKRADSHKHLGLTIKNNFDWNDHIQNTIVKAKKRIHCINNIKLLLPRRSLCSLYTTMVLPIIEYCDIIYDNCTVRNALDLENTQRRAALVCTGAYRHTSNDALLAELGWQPLRIRRQVHKLCLFFKIINNLTPPYLRSLIPRATETQYQLRSATNATLPIPYSRLSSTRGGFVHSTTKLWNNLNADVRSIATLSGFKSKMKLSLFKQHNDSFLPTLYMLMPLCKASVYHCRLRLGLSALNYHRFTYNFIPYKSCSSCNNACENICHFLFHCPAHAAPRAVLMGSLSNILPNNALNNLLRLERYLTYGSKELSVQANLEMFRYVANYIDATGRFN